MGLIDQQLAEFTVKRDLLGFHEWLLSSPKDDTAKTDNGDIGDHDFIRSYAEKIFSLGSSSNVLKIWQLYLKHFSPSNENMVHLFAVFLGHAKLLVEPGRQFQQVELGGASSLEKLIQQTSALITDFTLKEGHLLSLYHQLLLLRCLFLNQQTESQQLDQTNDHLYDLSDVFEATRAEQWSELFDHFQHLTTSVQLTYLQLMITKYRFLKISKIAEVRVDFDEVIVKVLQAQNPALIRFDVLQPILPTLSYSGLSTTLEHLFQLFTASADDQPNNRQIVTILGDADVWEQGGLPFQAAFITALLRTVIISQKSKVVNSKNGKGKKRKSPEEDENSSSTESSPTLNVLEILASKEKLWTRENRSTLMTSNSNGDSSAKSDNKIPALLRSASAAFLEIIRDNKQQKSSIEVNNRLLDLLLATVPLEHLTPVSQLRMILLLSTLLVSSSSLKSSEGRQKLASAFVTANRRIWASVRSVWLFDYLPPAEYIYAILVSLLKCSSNSTSNQHHQLDSACYSLFNDCLIANVFQLYDLPRSQANVTALVEVLNGGGDETVEKVDNLEYVLVMLQTMLLRANGAFVKKLTNGGKKFASGGHKEAFEEIGAEVGSQIYRNIKIYLEGASGEAGNSLESSEFVVEGLTRLFEYKVFAAVNSDKEGQEEGAKLKSKWRKLLTRFIAISLENISSNSGSESLDKTGSQQHFVNFLRVVVLNRARLHHGYSLSEDFVAQLWAKMTALEDDGEEDDLLQAKLSSNSHWRKILTSGKALTKWNHLLFEDQADNTLAEVELLEAYDRRLEIFKPLYGPLAQGSTPEEWNAVLLTSCTEMLSQTGSRTSSFLARALFAVRVMLELLADAQGTSFNLGTEKSKLLAEQYHLLLSGLLNVNLVAGKRWASTGNENSENVTKSLELLGRCRTDSLLLVRALLHRLIAANLLSNAHLFLALNIAAECTCVSLFPSNASSTLAKTNLSIFTSLFNAQNGLLQELLSRRAHLFLYSMASSLPLLTGMLVSLMRAADEASLDRANCTDADKLALEQCSGAYAHTVASLCRGPQTAEEFKGGSFALHLLAAYLHQAPTYSVVPFARKHLTAVAFSLIDLLQVGEGGGVGHSGAKKCSSLERLYSAIGTGPRELLKRLLEQYDKYHRFKGYV